jgi:hypothetical protein
LRFLALISREPFDYQEWRREYFSRYGVDDLLEEVENTTAAKLLKGVGGRKLILTF